MRVRLTIKKAINQSRKKSGISADYLPGDPGLPCGPGDPGCPERPGGPTKPGTPVRPCCPTGPGNPLEPGLPGCPGGPWNPGSPVAPARKHVQDTGRHKHAKTHE